MTKTEDARRRATIAEATRALAELRSGAGRLTDRQRDVVSGVESDQDALREHVARAEAPRPPSLERELPGPYVALPGGELTGGLPVAVQLGRGRNGVLVVTGLLLGWSAEGERQEVTARALRRVKLAEIVAEVAKLGDLPGKGEKAAVKRRAARRLVDDAPPVRPRRPGPNGHPPAYYQEVAHRYRRAVEIAPRSPVATLARELQVSVATAHRYRDRCIEMGLLEPIERRKEASAHAGKTTKGKKR